MPAPYPRNKQALEKFIAESNGELTQRTACEVCPSQSTLGGTLAGCVGTEILGGVSPPGTRAHVYTRIRGVSAPHMDVHLCKGHCCFCVSSSLARPSQSLPVRAQTKQTLVSPLRHGPINTSSVRPVQTITEKVQRGRGRVWGEAVRCADYERGGWDHPGSTAGGIHPSILPRCVLLAQASSSIVDAPLCLETVAPPLLLLVATPLRRPPFPFLSSPSFLPLGLFCLRDSPRQRSPFCTHVPRP